jgi:fucose 4-O-acetylase-like acetyltransferase
MDVLGVGGADSDSFPVYRLCDSLFAGVLAAVCVPLFFLLSGFLFFRNVDFNRQTYITKLRSRARTLLVPYLFWTFAMLLVIFIVRIFIRGLDTFESAYSVAFTPQYALYALWGGTLEGTSLEGPIIRQFWFLRDLMVLVVLTPLIHVYVKKLRGYGVALLCLLWFLGWWIKIPNDTAAFFFTIGAWLSINKRNPAVEAEKFKYWVFAFYPLLVVADMVTRDYGFNAFIHTFGTLVGVIFWLNVGVSFIRTTAVTPNKFLSAASFFIFAVHAPWLLTPIRNFSFLWLNPTSDAALVALYFAVVITIVLIGLGLYYVLRRFLPSFTNIITGGR